MKQQLHCQYIHYLVSTINFNSQVVKDFVYLSQLKCHYFCYKSAKSTKIFEFINIYSSLSILKIEGKIKEEERKLAIIN